MNVEPHWTSIIPPLLAVVLAFLTREVVVSLALACLAGVLLLGQGLQGFPALIIRSLAREDFIWIASIELCIGVLVAFFRRSGAVAMFTARAGRWVKSRGQVNVLGWLLGLMIFFSDYFSPLFVGPIMRDLTDKHRISREKLAYICDSTSAPLTAMIPITGWAVYISSQAIGSAGIANASDALQVFVRSIPFNFYSILTVTMVLMLALGVIRDFGPMSRAERRTLDTGLVLRDGAVPLMAKELTDLEVAASARAHLFFNFLMPILIIVGINLTTFLITGTPRILEGFMLACLVLGLTLRLQNIDDLQGIMRSVYAGIKGVMPAVMILALAYCINTVSKDMQTAQYVIRITEGWLRPALLPALIFVISGFISFATGTAWGTYAIMVPIAVPLAYGFNGSQMDALVLSSLAAVVGGGIFGDHCSPLSDTTVLSSLGSACDHIDHVKTQLPYALSAAAVVAVLYLVVGLIWSVGR
ncbi:MAG: transporter [Candidatus Aminicenantes bacterium]|nr:transporter [Candidatus Aminicenantes bacterium]